MVNTHHFYVLLDEQVRMERIQDTLTIVGAIVMHKISNKQIIKDTSAKIAIRVLMNDDLHNTRITTDCERKDKQEN